MTFARARLTDLLRIIMIAVACIFLGELGSLGRTSSEITPSLWLIAGFGVAICLANGYRMWPGIFFGTMLFTATSSDSWSMGTLIGAGYAMESLLTAWLIKRHTHIEDGFSAGGDVFKFSAFSALGALAASSAGSIALLLSGQIASNEVLMNCGKWALGDWAGIITMAPAILTWRNSFIQEWNKKKLLELAIVMALMGSSLIAIFLFTRVPLLYFTIPFILWLAFRFTQGEVTKAIVAIAVIATWGTATDRGPLSNQSWSPDMAFTLLQTFTSVLSITGLALAAALDKNRSFAKALQKARDELEVLVARRTEQLNAIVAEQHQEIIERQKVEDALRTKEKQFEEAQRIAHLGSWDWDIAKDIVTFSAEMCSIYGVDIGERHLNYAKYFSYIPPEHHKRVSQVVEAALVLQQPFRYEHDVVRPNGTIRKLRCRGEIEVNEQGEAIKLYGTAHDITEEAALAKSLVEAEERYRKLVEVSPDAIFLLTHNDFSFSNNAGLKLLGATGLEQLRGHSFYEFVSPDYKELVTESMAQLSSGGQVESVEGKMTCLDGAIIDVEFSAALFSFGGQQSTLLVARDISARKRAENQIQHLAHHDGLTGLANGMLFKERLEHAISNSLRMGKPLAVLFLDIDRFKWINDTSGHSAGDEVLRQTAYRLLTCLRGVDTVARLGGDEFLILIETYSDLRDVSAVGQKILDAMREPFHVGNKEFELSVSIGISTCPSNGQDVESLIKQADIAMYRVKAEGKNGFSYYSPTLTRQRMMRYAMESALRHAIDRGEMELYYQPKVNLLSGRMSGAEALIRWNHPEHGLLLPYRFISLAEEIGVISDIGLWAIRSVCSQSRYWRNQGLPPIRIAVNVAYPQLSNERLESDIVGILKDTGLNPDALELEITETMLMGNAAQLMHSLQRLRQVGIYLSIDDFGTGYSSLAYLKRLPVDSVKVDRSFIKDLPNDPDDVAITRAVLALIHSLKRNVVAEGVENREQMQFLVDHHCDEGQGFYFSAAIPANHFGNLLADEMRLVK
jgi:diguanylate cyclase (GGDEF)-like protein/PAS domain S-box-containing protein